MRRQRVTFMRSTHRKLYAITWLTDFSLFLLIFVVSRDLAERQASLLLMGVAGGGLSFTLAVSSIVFGHLSDRLGCQRLICAGVVVMLLSLAGCGLLAPGTAASLAAYCLAGVGAGLIYPPIIAWLSQAASTCNGASGVSRTLIRFCLAWNLGVICGQMSGGWLFSIGRHWPLVAGGGLLTVDLVVALTMRGTPVVTPGDASGLADSAVRRQSLSAAFARLSWIANLGGAFAISMIFHLFPKLVVELGIGSERHGMMLVLVRLVAISTYLLMYYSSFWHHRFSAALVAQSAAVAGLVMIVVASNQLMLLVGLAAVGLLVGHNYFASLYYSTSGASEERKGAASGIHEATLGIGFAGGSLLGGVLGNLAGIRVPYLLAAGLIIALAGVQIFVYCWHVRPLTDRDGVRTDLVTDC